MEYSSQTSSLLGAISGLGIFSIIIYIVILLIHLLFVVFIVKMAIEKGQNGINWGIFAFLIPELAFILLFRKCDYDSEYYNN